MTRARTHRMTAVLRCAAVATAVSGLLLACGAASAASAATPAPTTSGTSGVGAHTFGASLAWTSPGDAQRYAAALGGTPAMYGETLGYPLRSADVTELVRVTRASAAQGANVLLQLAPRNALEKLTTAEASDLAGELETLHDHYDIRFLVDFAPQMNGSWVRWGQQPDAFVHAFRTVASAVHRNVASASTIWEPANGAGYPFGRSRGEVTPSGPRVTAQLDTNHNGRVDGNDDPYGPYWPGKSYVDEVGFSDFWYGPPTHFGHNSLPTPGFFAKSLLGSVGYATTSGTGRDFVDRFSTSLHLPLLVETGALYVPGEHSGAPRTAIVDSWLGQVFAPSVQRQFPTLRSVLWFEQDRRSAEAGGRRADWRIATTPATAQRLHTLLTAGGYRLGPVPKNSGRTQANAAVAQANQPPGEVDSGTVRVFGGIVALLLIFLCCGAARRWMPSWRYPLRREPGMRVRSSWRRVDAAGRAIRESEGSGRDDRIDLLRGFVMVLVIVTHLELGGPMGWFTDRFGALTGAEMFVLLSGIVLGALYSRLASRRGGIGAATVMLRRAGRLWAETIAVILLVFFIARIPGIDGSPVTTFTDQGTGLGGTGAAGRVYYLYGTAQHLLDYPPPFYALRDLVLLRYGPWPMNIMGLFVVLSLAVPAAMWLIRRGLWWVLLLVSWGLYALNVVHPVTLFDAQFESVFPLFTWQIAFTNGLVIGRYRARITRALSSRAGLAAVTGVLVAYVGALLALRAGVRFAGVPTWGRLYDDWYQRVNLEGGRLVDLALCLIVFYAFLTTCWTPLHATIGRVFEPIGRWSLQVFYLQVFFVLFAHNIPHLSPTSAWQGFVVDSVAIAIAWAWSVWRDRRTAPPAPRAATPAPAEARELAASAT